jgi:hypothetical protein
MDAMLPVLSVLRTLLELHRLEHASAWRATVGGVVTLRTVSRIESGTVPLCNRGNNLLRMRRERQSCDARN